MTYHQHAASDTDPAMVLLGYIAHRWPVEAGQMFIEATTNPSLRDACELAGVLAAKAEAWERTQRSIGMQTRVGVVPA